MRCSGFNLVCATVIYLLICLAIQPRCSHLVGAEVFIVLTEEVATMSDQTAAPIQREDMVRWHDSLLESHLPYGSYTKLYSYTHLINGFAVHTTAAEALQILRGIDGIRDAHQDVKMGKATTHSPEFLGLPGGAWPPLGGARESGKGVVIGLIDTGIDPTHPSFIDQRKEGASSPSVSTKFKGKCETGERFPESSCGGKIAGARYFARAAIASGDFNATRDYASPFDADGHGSHTASTAAGNHRVPVIVNGYNYGYASGMAPGARVAVYKALYSFGGYMSDVVAAVDQAVEDGVDILSLSVGPASIPQGPAAFLNVLEMELLFATKAGVLVVQAAGNGGPSSSSILSFSPWIISVAASTTDRKYNNSIEMGNGQSFPGSGLSPPTSNQRHIPLAAAADVSIKNTSYIAVESCQSPDLFILPMVRGKLIICTCTFDFEFDPARITNVVETIHQIGASGFVLTTDTDLGSQHGKGTTMTFPVPGILLSNLQASSAMWEYYSSNTIRDQNSSRVNFGATARILDGRHAIFTRQAPIVASYSSRGPDVNNALLQTADILKPNIMAPGSSIWAAWSQMSEGDHSIKGQEFALISGTSMATPHIAGVAALIKQNHPNWTPAAIMSAMMTTADITDHSGSPIRAQGSDQLATANPFDYGAGFINPTRALNPGLVFDTDFHHFIEFLCSVPGVDDKSVRRATGIGCPAHKMAWCSDLNTASVTVSSLVGSRKVVRKVTSVTHEEESYHVIVCEPPGVTVKVKPRFFKISPNATRGIRIVLEAKESSNAYSYGEIRMEGSKKHVIRVPLAVYVSSAIGP